MSDVSLALAPAATAAFLHSREQMDLLRFVTCGSVDDGKSTLVGRLLLDAGAVYEDQIGALLRDSEKHGTTGIGVDPALIFDGLEDERQQGITIDVAYRYFQTAKRKFIISDCPGHQQYTRNMATAASTADLAIILVDARKGLLPQTLRHTFIVSLLGVRHVILAVNKMDQVNYDQAIFQELCDAYSRFTAELRVPHIDYLPLSGLLGENVVRRSSKMPWRQGPSLLELLETCEIPGRETIGSFRFAVQRVNRPNDEFRGFSGTVAAGTINVGEAVVALPSRKYSTVQSIVSFDGELQQAREGMAVTLTLADEIDVSRGDMLARPDELPQVERRAEAMLIWMSEQPLVPGKGYWLKHTTRRTIAEIGAVRYRVDVNDLSRKQAATLQLNEMGRCQVLTRDPIAYDPYASNRNTGSFVMVDRVTHETVAAGLILDSEEGDTLSNAWDDPLKSARLELRASRISTAQRETRYGHRAFTILITGLSGAGKTTIALALEEKLFDAGHVVILLDGQNLRHGLSRDLGFSAHERSENLRRAAEIAKLVNDGGIGCVAAFVAPDAEVRNKVFERIGRSRVLHVHLEAPIEVCRQRDRSGRYDAAERGEILDFPGVTASYDVPSDVDLVLNTATSSIEHCVASIQYALTQNLAEID